MIYIGLGANLPSKYGTPPETLSAAKDALSQRGLHIVAQSSTWLSAPVPYDADQEWFHNEVIAVETSLSAHDLLTVLLQIEEEFGRVRSVKNAPRLLDLDLIAYNDDVIKDADKLIVPHPRMNERLFVLMPLQQLDKNWTHPISGQNIDELIVTLGDDAGQGIKKL